MDGRVEAVHVLVLGAGVIGLTTALALVRNRHTVEVWAKEWSPETTSDVAAAFWWPYRVNPIDKVTRWAAESFRQFQQLENLTGAGVRKTRVVKLFRDRLEPPEWASITENYRESEVALPPGFSRAFSFDTYVIDMTLYMPYLMRSCTGAGVKFQKRALASLADTGTTYDIVVNCTGLGSRELLNDRELVAAKGQVVRVRTTGEVEHNIFLYEGDPTHFSMIVPRVNDIVLGGTYEESFSSAAADPGEIERIIDDCRQLSSNLAQIEVLGSASGLRPVRSSVRLELEQLAPDRCVIHNYGHGGAGVTLSWGCATEVAELVQSTTSRY